MDGKAKRDREFLPGASVPSLEERNHSDQGAQRDDQDSEGRDGAGVAQIRVAAVHVALLQGIAFCLGELAHGLVRAVTTDLFLAVDLGLNFEALIEPGAASLFLLFAVTAVVTIVAFERQN